MKVYDCFLFYNELDLLELRLRELYDHVDRFVIIESDHTLTNRAKKYLFLEHKNRFQPWLDKIWHVRHQSLKHSDPWKNVTDQRNAIEKILDKLDDFDLVILNDADEILRPHTIQQMKQSQAMLYCLRMPIFNFKFNYMKTAPGAHEPWTSAARASWVKQFGGQVLRNQLNNMVNVPYVFRANGASWSVQAHDICEINHAGWHFSYLGDSDYVIDKLQNTVHQEDNVPEKIANIDIDLSIGFRKSWDTSLPYQYEIVDIDNYFPESCKLFPKHCLANSGIRALDLLS